VTVGGCRWDCGCRYDFFYSTGVFSKRPERRMEEEVVEAASTPVTMVIHSK
jgi:hypothetical protein